MDIYIKPVNDTYQVSRLKWFEMPLTDGSSRWVIAVKTTEAQYWIIAYSILVGMIYSALTKLMTVLVLALYPEAGGANLQAMLVAFYNNSNSATTALSSMLNFALQSLKSEPRVEPKKKRIGWWCCLSVLCYWKFPDKAYKVNWMTLRYCSILAGACFCLIAGDVVSKFVVSGSRLIVRHASRANPSAIYYPNMALNVNALEIFQPLRAAAAMQSAGRVEAAKGLIDNMTDIKSIHYRDDLGRPNIALNFSYSITGIDMGLQLTPNLTYTVKGWCRTEYSWVNTTYNSSFPDRDFYPLWGSTWDLLADVQAEKESLFPIWVNVVPRYTTGDIPKMQGGDEYALVPGVSHRQSLTPNNDDPWYLTEKTGRNSTSNADIKDYQVRRQRPPVHCWQNVTWSLKGKTVTHVDYLDELPGLRISPLVRSIFRRDFVSPTLIQVANNLGYAALASSMLNMVVNKHEIVANRCNVTKDLERLIQISFVYSRDAIRNVVLLYSSQRKTLGLPNLAAGPDGRVPDENGDFILESKDVAALAVSTLLAVPSVCAILWITVFALSIKWDKIGSNSGYASRLNFRRIALQASQLYRYLDEELTGLRRWSGRLSTPYINSIDVRTKEGEASEGKRAGHNPPASALQRTAPDDPQTPASRQAELGDLHNSDLKEMAIASVEMGPLPQQPPPPEAEQPSASQEENQSLLPCTKPSAAGRSTEHPTASRPPPLSRITVDGVTYWDCIVPKLIPIDDPETPPKPERSPEGWAKIFSLFDKKEERPERYELVMTPIWKEDINGGKKIKMDEVVADFEVKEVKETGDLEHGR